MYNNSIEDIMIDKNFDQKNKKGKPMLVIFIIFIIILLLAGAVYCYFTIVNKQSNKELFFQGLLNTNLEFFVQDEIYQEILKKFSSTNFEMNSDITIPSVITNEEVEQEDSNQDEFQQFDFSQVTSEQFESQQEEQEIDFTKYLLNLTTINNIENEEFFSQLNVAYEDNNVSNMKMINNKNDFAVFSDKLASKYVGVHKNNIGLILEKVDVDETIVNVYENIKNQADVEKINIDEILLQEKINEYKELLLSKLPEEKFVKLENQISLVKESSQEEIAVQAYKLGLTQVELNTIIKDVLTNLRNDEEFIKKIITNQSNDEISENIENIETETTLKIEEILPSLLLGKKINATVEEVQNIIDEGIKKISDEGNGLEITVYVSELKTEKISVVLPDVSTIDIEFNPTSEDEKELAITYLYEEDVVEYGEDNMAVYSATENTIPEEATSITEKQTNGVKLEISKQKYDASRTIEVVFNIIKNKEITQKTVVDIKTKGTSTSKTFNTDCLITYSDKKGEFKVNLKNKINFEKASEIEKLTDENCMYLDALGDEELSSFILEIILKANGGFSENLTDENVSTTPNRDELRNLVVTTIGMQMGEAQARGETYTIYNIEGLQINGHIVTVIIQNEVAEVTVDGIKFRIDSNFNLSDAE